MDDATSDLGHAVGTDTMHPAVAVYVKLLEGAFEATMTSPGRDRIFGGWAPGSVIDRDMENAELRLDGSPWGPEPVKAAYSYACVATIACADHLASMATVLRCGPTMFGIPVLARAALETSSQLRWSLEGPDLRTRTARSSLLRLDGLGRRVPMLRALAAPAETIAAAKQRYRAACKATNDLGLAVSRKGYEVLGVEGQSNPSRRGLVRESFSDLPIDGNIVYDYLSGISHGSLPALLEAFESDDGRFSPTLGEHAVRPIVIAALYAHSKALQALIAWTGWSPAPFQDWYQQARSELFS